MPGPVGRFGLCCCQQPGVLQSAAAQGTAMGFGNNLMDAPLGSHSCDAGHSLRYLKLTAMTSAIVQTGNDPVTGPVVTLFTTTGTIRWSQYNGSIIFHSIGTTSSPVTAAALFDTGFPHGFPASAPVLQFGGTSSVGFTNSGLSATWVDLDNVAGLAGTVIQSITLDEPHSVLDLKATALELLGELDVTAVPLGNVVVRRWNFKEAAAWYVAQINPAIDLLNPYGTGLIFPIAGAAWASVPQIAGGGSISIFDADIPAFAEQKVTDPPSQTGFPFAIEAYEVCGQPMDEFDAQRRLYAPLPPGSLHCYEEDLLIGIGQALASSTCAQVTADGGGRVVLDPPDLVPDTVSTIATLQRQFFPNKRPGPAPGGCPCQ